jgi:glycosyltransferase involved in cell wall biosynthesis
VIAKQEQLFYEAVVKLIKNEILRIDFGNLLYNTVDENYSEETVMKNYLEWLQTI